MQILLYRIVSLYIPIDNIKCEYCESFIIWETILLTDSSRMPTQFDKTRIPSIVAKCLNNNTGISSK